ncbi:hypothetical protein KP509_16G008900 [Ceratopteris richardii]|uniref:Uncharacterized protein n=1 Tax=Ceratopteris richardii TaxID=49495 RepID=A0A8T2SYK3_CERRI|nr:hypothetical protein KP509_16G008900 [Ceratopteris richardii]
MYGCVSRRSESACSRPSTPFLLFVISMTLTVIPHAAQSARDGLRLHGRSRDTCTQIVCNLNHRDGDKHAAASLQSHETPLLRLRRSLPLVSRQLRGVPPSAPTTPHN